jgi:hypothetical protein
MNKILDKLNIDETYTKPLRKIKFDHVKDNVFPAANYNDMADVLYLPQTSNGYKYLLVVVDLYTNAFDIEPMKQLTADAALKAFQAIIKRKYIKLPYASIRTDNGNEFKGVFHKYMYDHSVLQRYAEPYRKQQLANVESLNAQLGRLFNGYMNMKELQTHKAYRNWNDIIDTVRVELNEKRKLNAPPSHENIFNVPLKDIDVTKEPKFKIGDLVYPKLEVPYSALGHKQNTTNFRKGDFRYDIKNPRAIEKILYYPNNIRYILEGRPNVSYVEQELKLAPNQEQVYEVKEIIGKRKNKGKIEYLVWWSGYKKSEATYEPINELIKDGLKDMIDRYEEEQRRK